MEQNKSAARAMDLLLLLAKCEKPLTLTEIQSEMHMPKSSTFSLVYTLVEKGFIEQNDRVFSLGINNFIVGSSYANKIDFIQIARPYLEKIAFETGETCFLGKVVDNKIIYVDKHIGTADVVSTCELGTFNDMYSTALGKSILATYNKNKLEEYLSLENLQPKTANTLLTLEEFINDARLIYERGFAVEDREGSDTMFCVASCIKKIDNEVVGSISIATPWYKMSDEKILFYGELIKKSALDISRKMGFQGKNLY